MRRYLLSGIIVIAVGLAAVLYAEPPPRRVVISTCKSRVASVALPHAEHVQKLKIACKTCHHTGKPDKRCGASACHAGKATPKRPGCAEAGLLKNPYHITCIGCHEQKHEGPRRCKQCHS